MKRKEITRYFRHQPILETERLILRQPTALDAPDMYRYAKDECLTKYLTWYPHLSEEQTRGYLAYLEDRYALGEFFDWAVIEKGSGRMIGTCGFTRFRYEDDCGEIGYVLARDFWGKGYMPEAVQAVIRYGFNVLPLQRIEAKFIEGNVQSKRLLEKLGFTFEGYQRNAMRIKGVLSTIGTSSLLREEYEMKSN